MTLFNKLRETKPDLYRHLEQTAQSIMLIGPGEDLSSLNVDDPYVKAWFTIEIKNYHEMSLWNSNRSINNNGGIGMRESDKKERERVAQQIANTVNARRTREPVGSVTDTENTFFADMKQNNPELYRRVEAETRRRGLCLNTTDPNSTTMRQIVLSQSLGLEAKRK